MGPATRVDQDKSNLLVRVCLNGTEQRVPISVLAKIDFAQLNPVTKAPSWRGRDAYSGAWWLRSTGSSTTFASLGERDLLIREDYSNTIDRLWFRPFEILDQSNRRLLAPTYLVQRSDRTLDAFTRPTEGYGRDLLQTIHQETGIRVVPSPPPSAPESMNLEWLAGYRFTRCDPDKDCERDLIDAFRTPTGLGRGLRRLKRGAAQRPELVSYALNLMWRQILTSRTLRTARLSMETEVYSACNH